VQNGKTVFVTGATGNQGGAVTRHLLARGFGVKALTRDPGSPKAMSLAAGNVAIVKGDLNDPQSYQDHLKNADAVFCCLQLTTKTDQEVRQGKALVSLAAGAGIKHFIYSSVIGCDRGTGIPHWESKKEIEDHLKISGMNYTILRPSSLYENLLIPAVKNRIQKGKLVLPTRADTVQQFISAEDIGMISAIIFSDPQQYKDRTITLASGQLDGKELATVFSRVMQRDIKFQQLPGLIVRLVMGKDLAKMFRWVNQNDAVFVKDLEGFKKEFPGMLTTEKWIENNFMQVPPVAGIN